MDGEVSERENIAHILEVFKAETCFVLQNIQIPAWISSHAAFLLLGPPGIRGFQSRDAAGPSGKGREGTHGDRCQFWLCK